MGATSLTSAAAAGMVIGTSTVLAVLLYATACWTWGSRRADQAVTDSGLGPPAEVIELPVAATAGAPELDLAA